MNFNWHHLIDFPSVLTVLNRFTSNISARFNFSIRRWILLLLVSDDVGYTFTEFQNHKLKPRFLNEF